MKGLIVNIYTNKMFLSDANACDWAKDALLVGEGIPEIFESDDDRPVLKLVTRKFRDRTYMHVEPVAECPPDMRGWMAGGAFVYTSDSRFPNPYPLSLHDRAEVVGTL